MVTDNALATLYREAHNTMRNIDGLQPQEAFEELLKYLLFRQFNETSKERVGVSRTLNLLGGFSAGDEQTCATIRRLFSKYLKEFEGSAAELWKGGKIKLSDRALLAIHEQFATVNFTSLGFDVRSAALRNLLSPELRKGLGIYLTPDDVVRSVVYAAAPPLGSLVFDPACGAGTFLVETLHYWSENGSNGAAREVHGTDINGRMLLLAELNLGHMPGVAFKGRMQDALVAKTAANPWPAFNSVDFIFTNPPFGVYVDHKLIGDTYDTLKRSGGAAKVQSEVLFIERCLRWLRPGGTLGIVLPRSVVTNERLAGAREAIDDLGALVGMMNLPPETFAATGTMTNTVVLFIRKHEAGPVAAGSANVAVVDVTNVGYDTTGRERAGNQLQQASIDLAEALRTGRPTGMARHVVVPAARPLSTISEASTRKAVTFGHRRLAEFVESAQTGRTPPRAKYIASGAFTIKVGNLTGRGIDWTPRERNFVAPEWISDALVLQEGDILLTSSAHNPKYIAQKVDVVYQVPDFVGPRPSFTGEVLRIRVKKGIDPFAMQAFLRLPATRAAIQDMIRGQTAHLRPKDLLELPVPDDLAPEGFVPLLKEEAELARQLNLVKAKQRALIGAVAEEEGE